MNETDKVLTQVLEGYSSLSFNVPILSINTGGSEIEKSMRMKFYD